MLPRRWLSLNCLIPLLFFLLNLLPTELEFLAFLLVPAVGVESVGGKLHRCEWALLQKYCANLTYRDRLLVGAAPQSLSLNYLILRYLFLLFLLKLEVQLLAFPLVPLVSVECRQVKTSHCCERALLH